MSKTADPYHGRDPRQVPAYTTFDAARYLRLPEPTLRNWLRGSSYVTAGGNRRQSPPLVKADGATAYELSFLNLIELHVLGILRREHGVKMPKIRRAIDYLKEQLHSQRPLIDDEMETEGTNIFVEKLGSLINVSQNGQLAMSALLREHLKRIERDANGVPFRLFPFTRPRADLRVAAELAALPKIISIDPAVAFGRPVIVGSRVPTTEIFQRFNAGESPEELAADFGRQLEEIHEAIRCESAAA